MTAEKKHQLLCAVDSCNSISELFELVRKENIDIRMQTLCSASCIPPKPVSFDPADTTSPLEKLKNAVSLAVHISK